MGDYEQFLHFCVYIQWKLRKFFFTKIQGKALKLEQSQHESVTCIKMEDMGKKYICDYEVNQFCLLHSTEVNFRADNMNFYGLYSHIRETLDYKYHCNYTRERQLFQDAIVENMLNKVEITDINGDICTTPTDPFIVFTAGSMGAGKSYTMNALLKRELFPLHAFV